MQILWVVKRYAHAGEGAGAGKCVFSNRSKLPNPLLAVSCFFRFLVLTKVTGESTAAICSLIGPFYTRGEGGRGGLGEAQREREGVEYKVDSYPATHW